MTKTVEMLEAIEAYPKGERVFYPAGSKLDFEDDFADLLIAKGHAREVQVKEKPAKSVKEPEAS